MVWLRMPEEKVWRLTPRKLQALLRVHRDIKLREAGKAPANNGVDGYIDNIPGW